VNTGPDFYLCLQPEVCHVLHQPMLLVAGRTDVVDRLAVLLPTRLHVSRSFVDDQSRFPDLTEPVSKLFQLNNSEETLKKKNEK